MKAHMYHLSGFAYMLNLTDGTQVVVTDKRLRDEMIASRLASAAYKEFPLAEFKSRYSEGQASK